jgi:hypothetical protein
MPGCDCQACPTCVRRQQRRLATLLAWHQADNLYNDDDDANAGVDEFERDVDMLDAGGDEVLYGEREAMQESPPRLDDSGPDDNGAGLDGVRELRRQMDDADEDEEANIWRPIAEEDEPEFQERINVATRALEDMLIEDDEDPNMDLDLELEAAIQEGTPFNLVCSSYNLTLHRSEINSLSNQDINSIKAFLIGADDANPASEALYGRIRSAFPELDIQSFYLVRQRIRRLANISAISIAMCPNSCRAFRSQVDIEAASAGCPDCGATVFIGGDTSKPILTFDYLPLLPRLAALYSNKSTARTTQTYRSSYLDNV